MAGKEPHRCPGLTELGCGNVPYAPDALVIEERNKPSTGESYFAVVAANGQAVLSGLDYCPKCGVNLFRLEEILEKRRKNYPQGCQCENYEGGLVANDCHEHNEHPMHFVGDESFPCDCP